MLVAGGSKLLPAEGGVYGAQLLPWQAWRVLAVFEIAIATALFVKRLQRAAVLGAGALAIAGSGYVLLLEEVFQVDAASCGCFGPLLDISYGVHWLASGLVLGLAVLAHEKGRAETDSLAR